MKKFFYSLFFLLALVGLAGCGTQDTASNPATAATPTTPTTSTPTPTSQTLNQTGTGVVVAPSFTVSSAGNVVFALTHDGSSNFIVELKNSAGTTVNTLVNEIGSFTGQVDAALVPGEYHLSIAADGNWTASITGFVTDGTVAPPTTDPAVGVPTTVVLLSTLAAGTQLSQGGETQVSATVRDVNNGLVPDGIIVNFSTDKGTVSSQATTINGVATVTFQAGSSAGAATVTASTLGAAGLVQGTTSIDIANGQSSSIVVSSVQPASIGIRGSGIEDTSLIVFEVRDDAGNPAIDGTIVSFSLSIAVNGGENLSASSAQSAGGLVSVALQSGTVSGTVAVRASVDKGAGTFLVTEAKITIANNRPDAGRITMGATVLNLAGGVTLGLQSEVSAYIGDRAGNVVPDGWPVSFISECGTIGTSGGFNTSTALGVASATFQTSAPDPSALTGIAPLGTPGYCRLVAYTPGKGNFQDLNGNGVFDGSDVCVTEMDEPYIDANDSGVFETGEFYIDINNNGSFDANVVNCVDDSMIWTSMNLMISDYAAPLDLTPSTFNLPVGGNQSFSLKIIDILGNSLVEGTTISISADGGSLIGQTTYTLPDLVSPGMTFNFALASDQQPTDPNANPPDPQFVTVKATLSPAGDVNNNGAEIFDIAAGMINLATVTVSSPLVSLTTALPVGTQLAQGEVTTLKAIVLTEEGVAPPDGTVVSFSASNGLVIPSTAVTVAGVAATSYTAPAFGGPISATASALGVDGVVSFDVSAGDASTIVLSSVTPAQIGVRGGGLADTSVIVFDVLDQVGNPAVDGTLVNFSQTVMTGGGERLSSTSAQSINGKVQVVLQSGVRSGAAEIAGVLAVNGGSSVVTTARVVIAAGLPDAKHFSLSALPLNLPGYVFYGEKSLITAYLADRYSNPVPVATPVFFESEAGAMALEDLTGSSLGDNKTNGAGQAFATQITQAPKPDTLPNKGLSTILAWTIGAESFVDLNGNGIHDTGEPFGDLGEPYIDANDNGTYDAATTTSAEERYVDINGDSNYNGPNGQWDGQTAIWTDMDVLWSGLTAKPVISPASFNIAAGASQDFTITAADVNGNPLPAGATVTVSKTCFSGISLSGDTNVTIPDALAAKVGTTQFSVNFSSASTVVGDPMPCTLIVEVSEPTTGTTTAVVNGFID